MKLTKKQIEDLMEDAKEWKSPDRLTYEAVERAVKLTEWTDWKGVVHQLPKFNPEAK